MSDPNQPPASVWLTGAPPSQPTPGQGAQPVWLCSLPHRLFRGARFIVLCRNRIASEIAHQHPRLTARTIRRLLDRYRLQQQDTLGVLGVNLIHCAFNYLQDVENLIPALTENIKAGQVAIDLIRFVGPDVAHINNHLMNLELVRRGLAQTILFGPDESLLTISDELYQKSVVIQRGTYRPVTTTHMDVLQKGVEQFKKEFPLESKKELICFELTMNSLSTDGNINEQDFLDRVKALAALGYHVLVSNFFLYYQLKKFLRQYTQEPFILIVGASHLEKLFAEDSYKDLEGGVLEGLGKLLDAKTKLYVYPHKTAQSCMTTKTFFPAPNVIHIYKHFLDQKQICDISACDETSSYLHSDQVRDLIFKTGSHLGKIRSPKNSRDDQKRQSIPFLLIENIRSSTARLDHCHRKKNGLRWACHSRHRYPDGPKACLEQIFLKIKPR